MATAACKSGKVKIGDKNMKPSYMLTAGETVYVKKNGFDLTFLVKEIIGKRVSATLAAPCYDNLTTDDELNKYKNWYIGKAAAERREPGAGRPTKRDRRELEDYKDLQFLLDQDFEDD